MAKASGRTPAEVLEDPDLEFNLAVMRGAMEAERVAIETHAATEELRARPAE